MLMILRKPRHKPVDPEPESITLMEYANWTEAQRQAWQDKLSPRDPLGAINRRLDRWRFLRRYTLTACVTATLTLGALYHLGFLDRFTH